MRSLEEITSIVELYLPEWRHWCAGPEEGGCACMGCVRVPPFGMYPGDPEHYFYKFQAGDLKIKPLTKEEFQLWFEKVG